MIDIYISTGKNFSRCASNIFSFCCLAVVYVIWSSMAYGNPVNENSDGDKSLFFEDRGDYIIDYLNRLIWMKCPYVQEKGNGCKGSPGLLRHDVAEEEASRFNLGDFRKWRLPTLKELQSIYEVYISGVADSSIVNPLIGKRLGLYWTSTISDIYHRQYWALDSGDGEYGVYMYNSKFFVLFAHDFH